MRSVVDDPVSGEFAFASPLQFGTGLVGFADAPADEVGELAFAFCRSAVVAPLAAVPV